MTYKTFPGVERRGEKIDERVYKISTVKVQGKRERRLGEKHILTRKET